jgi:hypothetical protein
MISDAVLIAIIVAVPAVLTSVVAPVLIAWQQHRNRLEEKREDRAREDEVAAKLQASQTLVSDRTDITNRKLDKIHVLVNSNMTAAMQSELDAKIETAAIMRELIELRRATDKEPSAASLKALATIDGKIAELRAQLDDRLMVTARANQI